MVKNAKNMKFLFTPKSVAVIGASDKQTKLGFHCMKSLIKGGFEGRIIPVNPGSDEIMGLKAFPSLADCGGPIDLAIVVLPAKLVPGVFRECVAKGVKGIVLITAGFKEIDDPAGAVLHGEIAEIADNKGIPVIGPNTFGMINLRADLNASFTPEFSRLKKGSVALVSQSGGISHLIGFLAMRMDVGFSKIVGLGNRLNVDFAETVDYLMDDSDTRVIMLYMEGIDDPGKLMKIVRKHNTLKPVIIHKTGRSAKSDQASRSHTGSIAGSHNIYMGAFRQAGMLGVDNTETLLDTARALAACPIPDGPEVAVLSGQAGPGMEACDVCEALGLRIARFTGETQARINGCLPPLALRTNPVDMGPAWYDSSAMEKIVKAVMEDDNVNGIILMMIFASANADALRGISGLLKERTRKKPLIGCILSPPGIWDEQIKMLEQSGALINYPTPKRAASAMANLWKYQELQLGRRVVY